MASIPLDNTWGHAHNLLQISYPLLDYGDVQPLDQAVKVRGLPLAHTGLSPHAGVECQVKPTISLKANSLGYQALA